MNIEYFIIPVLIFRFHLFFSNKLPQFFYEGHLISNSQECVCTAHLIKSQVCKFLSYKLCKMTKFICFMLIHTCLVKYLFISKVCFCNYALFIIAVFHYFITDINLFLVNIILYIQHSMISK